MSVVNDINIFQDLVNVHGWIQKYEWGLRRQERQWVLSTELLARRQQRGLDTGGFSAFYLNEKGIEASEDGQMCDMNIVLYGSVNLQQEKSPLMKYIMYR